MSERPHGGVAGTGAEARSVDRWAPSWRRKEIARSAAALARARARARPESDLELLASGAYSPAPWVPREGRLRIGPRAIAPRLGVRSSPFPSSSGRFPCGISFSRAATASASMTKLALFSARSTCARRSLRQGGDARRVFGRPRRASRCPEGSTTRATGSSGGPVTVVRRPDDVEFPGSTTSNPAQTPRDHPLPWAGRSVVGFPRPATPSTARAPSSSSSRPSETRCAQ